MLYSHWGTWKNLPDQQIGFKRRRNEEGSPQVYSLNKESILRAGEGRDGAEPSATSCFSYLLPCVAWFCISFTQQESLTCTALASSFNSPSFRTELLLLLSVLKPSVCTFIKPELIIHQNCHIRLLTWLVPFISRRVPPLFESFCLLIEYLK